MSDSTPTSTPRKPRKPRGKIPLSIHKASGQWCKRIRGKVYYYGRVDIDPKGIAAKEKYLREKDDREAGRQPRERLTAGGKTVQNLVDEFLAHQEVRRDGKELKPRSYQCLYATCKTVSKVFGNDRALADLEPADFAKLRATLAGKRKLVALRNEIGRVRYLFAFAVKQRMIPQEPFYGVCFDKPTQEKIDEQAIAHREEHGDRMFEADEIRLILDALAGKEVTIKGENGKPVKVTLEPDPPLSYKALRAMVLLGVNCGFGQSDCSGLPTKIVDLDNGWANFPRVKRAVARRCPLWPETVAAIREWLVVRPAANEPEDAKLLFLRQCGMRCVKLTANGAPDDAVGKQFAEVLGALNLKRPGRSFYALRHTFTTVGIDIETDAVKIIMGHKIRGMIVNYIERFNPDRLRRVTDHVRAWIFPPPLPEKEKTDAKGGAA